MSGYPTYFEAQFKASPTAESSYGFQGHLSGDPTVSFDRHTGLSTLTIVYRAQHPDIWSFDLENDGYWLH